MHREFQELLEKATGRSEFVVVVYVDIRGFSSFAKTVESPEAAMFVKRVYMKLIDEYFPNACFFKPAGDGLLVTIPYTEEDLEEVAVETVGRSLELLEDFGSFCVDDPMINFRVPQKVGIGISRGTACCLVSGDKLLDYSGRVLNLAARLMDMARPSGIVLDADFGIELLPDEVFEMFETDSVYIRGIAEREPIEICYTKDYTRISPLYKHALEEVKWKTLSYRRTLKEVKETAGFIYDLPSKPIDPDQVKVRVSCPLVVRGRKRKGLVSYIDFRNFEYYLEAGKPQLRLSFDALARRLIAKGVKSSWDVEIKIMYPEKWG